mmetsp:Transcript_23892/g.80690  ORF Transcript_23892/g.80690 Transcript_23892/m.80690 type:complete len:314 (+) Transcript_23892:433-1374(+)
MEALGAAAWGAAAQGAAACATQPTRAALATCNLTTAPGNPGIATATPAIAAGMPTIAARGSAGLAPGGATQGTAALGMESRGTAVPSTPGVSRGHANPAHGTALPGTARTIVPICISRGDVTGRSVLPTRKANKLPGAEGRLARPGISAVVSSRRITIFGPGDPTVWLMIRCAGHDEALLDSFHTPPAWWFAGTVAPTTTLMRVAATRIPHFWHRAQKCCRKAGEVGSTKSQSLEPPESSWPQQVAGSLRLRVTAKASSQSLGKSSPPCLLGPPLSPPAEENMGRGGGGCEGSRFECCGGGAGGGGGGGGGGG